MLLFRTLVLWVHLGAIIVWIGGIFYTAIVVGPTLKSSIPSPHNYAQLLWRFEKRFRRFNMELIIFILLSGIFNLINSGWTTGFNFSGTYMTLVAVKAVLFVGIVALQHVYGNRFLPQIVEMTEGFESDFSLLPDDFTILRKKIMQLLGASTVMSLVALFIGLYLRYV